MSLQQEIIEDLDAEVLFEFGKQVTLIRNTGSEVLNSRGEIESIATTTTTITAVPYDIVETRMNSEAFGQLKEGDMEMAIRYDQLIEENDKVVIEGITYKVSEISKNFLPGNVVTIVRLTRVPEQEAYDTP